MSRTDEDEFAKKLRDLLSNPKFSGKYELETNPTLSLPNGGRFSPDFAIVDKEKKRYAYFDVKQHTPTIINELLMRHRAVNALVKDAIPNYLITHSEQKGWLAYLPQEENVPQLLNKVFDDIFRALDDANNGIRTVGNYLFEVQRLKNRMVEEGLTGSVFYRGQTNANWHLTPSLFRNPKDENDNDLGFTYYEEEENLIRDARRRFPLAFRNCHTEFDQLAMAQHYEIPTRLLDVTGNALVALFFAVQENNERAGKGKVFLFNASQGEMQYALKCGTEDIVKISGCRSGDCFRGHRKPLLVLTSYNTERQRVQKSAFYVLGNNNDGSLNEFKADAEVEIPYESKNNLREELDKNCNINISTLFPESLSYYRDNIVSDAVERLNRAFSERRIAKRQA